MVAGFVDFLLQLGFVAAFEFDLHEFPDADVFDALKSMDSSACLTVLPCGSSTVFFGMTMILAFT